LKSLDLFYKSLSWDGMKLIVDYNGKGHKTSATRDDLLEYLPELDYEKMDINTGKKVIDSTKKIKRVGMSTSTPC